MSDTTTLARPRRSLSALVAAALLASLLVVAPRVPAEAHTGGCGIATSHNHNGDPWWYRSTSKTYPTIGRLVTWERSWQNSPVWNPIGTYHC